MSVNRETKENQIQDLKGRFDQSKTFYLLDYVNIPVGKSSELRRQLRENDCSLKVVKNRLALRALLEMDLKPKLIDDQKLAIWFAFWGEVKSRPTYRKICDEYDRYYDSVVEKLCAGIIDEGGYTSITAAAAAEALTCMTNGLWLSCLISPKDFDRDIGWNAIMSYLANVFPRHYETA